VPVACPSRAESTTPLAHVRICLPWWFSSASEISAARPFAEFFPF
jgi:hypothetical protein